MASQEPGDTPGSSVCESEVSICVCVHVNLFRIQPWHLSVWVAQHSSLDLTWNLELGLNFKSSASLSE